MEEDLCTIEIIKDNNDYVAMVTSEMGGKRDYRSQSFEEVLDQLRDDLMGEFEPM
jgi:hypothetical protein